MADDHEDQPGQPGPMPTGPHTPTPPPPPGAPSYGGPPGPPPMTPADRVLVAVQGRGGSDYLFDYWTALGWTVLTLGFYGFYVFYQLVRRIRDHNARRLELFDASLTFAWQEAERRGLQEELSPSFQRAAGHMAVLRQMTGEFRDPTIWLVLSIVASTIVEIVAFVLLDQDLVTHDRAEVGVEYELSLIYGRLGQYVPPPDQGRVKAPDNYAGRIVATVFSFGFYLLWWFYDQMVVPNRHFAANWAQEDALSAAVRSLA